jgi:2-iminobutanoate/2-iminopropanoate deaminase
VVAVRAIRVDVPGITTGASPYPSAVDTGALVFVSGQVSFDDQGRVVAPGDAAGQTRQCLTRLERVLESLGCSLTDVVSATVYLTDAGFSADFNAEWGQWFGGHRPARATVVADLLDPALLIEVQAIAVRETKGPR